MPWNQWLDVLRALPAEAPEWDAIPGFLEAVQALAETRRREREAARDRVQQALATLLEHTWDDLLYFGMSDMAIWHAVVCPLPEAKTLADQVERLQAMLLEYRALRQRPAVTLAEERQRRVALEAQEELVSHTHRQLTAVFLPAAEPVLGLEVPSLEEDGRGEGDTLAVTAIGPTAAGAPLVVVEGAGGEPEPTTVIPAEETATPSVHANVGLGENTEALHTHRQLTAAFLPAAESPLESEPPPLAEDGRAEDDTLAVTAVGPAAAGALPVPVAVEGAGGEPEPTTVIPAEETATPSVHASVGLDENTEALHTHRQLTAAFLPAAESPLESEPPPLAEDGRAEDDTLAVTAVGPAAAGAPPVVALPVAVEEAGVETALNIETLSLETTQSPVEINGATGQEVASVLLSEDNRNDRHAVLWQLMIEDDLPAAYWLARSFIASGHPSPVPDWLLAATQGARWLSSSSDAFVGDLLDIAKHYQPLSDDDIQVLLGLAAALCPTLMAPASGLIGWLNVPACCPILHSLVTAVREFARLGVALRPGDALGIAGREQREAALAQATRAAKQWLDEAPSWQTKLKRASDVWRYLVGLQGPLRALLLPVSEDRRAEIEEVRQRLRQWQQRDYVLDQLNRIDLELTGKKGRPIDGPKRDKLMHDVADACGLAQRWCDLVEHEREIEARGTWLFEQVAQLRTSVQQILPEVEVALGELSAPTRAAPLAAAGHCLRRAVRQLQAMLSLPSGTAEHESLVMHAWEWFSRDAANLYIGLSRRLLWLPELSLGEDGQPLAHDLPLIASALRQARRQERSLRAAFESWLQKQDYRLVQRLLDALCDEADAADLARRYQDALTRSRAALRDALAATNDAIEQALVDGIIAEERSEYSAAVIAVYPEDVLDFPTRDEALRKVRDALSVARKQRLEGLDAAWQDLQERLAASHIEPPKQEQLRAFISTALTREDTRVVEECLSRFTEVLDTGSDLEEAWLTAPTTRDVLTEFKTLIPQIEGWLGRGSLQTVVNDIQQGRQRASIRFVEMPVPRREEAARAVVAWRHLKQQRPKALEDPHSIATLLRYLGFNLESDMGSPVRVDQRGEDWLYARVLMSASDLAKPIPQFGSQAQGRYDVICLWERPGADTIAARLQELRLTGDSVLTIYLGRLTRQSQRDVIRISREQELAFAVLDEILLLFLARERDARLPVFLRCALPFTALNPYTPFQSGDVPPEVFFGRDAMARELQRPAGSCLVYGGRQLGKSALLHHVQRQFRYPERERYAWVENMKLIFDPQAGKDTTHIWRALREGFKREGLLPARVKADRAEDITRHLHEAMLQNPERRVLVMFDEADDFLDSDARDNFRIVTALRELMLATQRRFKVIFAGLHNVQRFQGIPNQPLAHFGTALCVGPLEPDAAQQLVRQPLEVLGYHFADPATVLRILSYTNYHPGLIQLFCQELLKRLHMQAGDAVPP